METTQIKNGTTTEDYNVTTNVKASPEQAQDAINRVQDWWAKDFEGKSQNLNDEFIVHFGDTYVEFKVTAMDPGKKVAWLVTDCNLGWINDKKEWKNTRVVFDITPSDNGTAVKMTHIGLVPGAECYDSCKPGWDGHIKNSLVKLMEEGKGMPE